MESSHRISAFIKDEKVKNIFNQVFDYRAIEAIHKLANDGYIDHLEYIISTGKEAHVYKAVDNAGNPRAVKIYKIETGHFRNMRIYIEGDMRFKNTGHDRQSIIYQWTRKEYKNLEKFSLTGVRVPAPYAFSHNVLVMEYIGNEKPAPILKKAPIKDIGKLYGELVEQIAKMIYKAKLVHADLSEYNILNFHNEPVIIDCGQAVLLSHPFAKKFFERDIENIADYLSKHGLEKTPEAIRADISAARPVSEQKR